MKSSKADNLNLHRNGLFSDQYEKDSPPIRRFTKFLQNDHVACHVVRIIC